MHLLFAENCLTMDEAAAMKSDTQLHSEDDGRAEESSRLDYVDFPQSSFTDRESTSLLRYQDATEHSPPIKYRRYG